MGGMFGAMKREEELAEDIVEEEAKEKRKIQRKIKTLNLMEFNKEEYSSFLDEYATVYNPKIQARRSAKEEGKC